MRFVIVFILLLSFTKAEAIDCSAERAQVRTYYETCQYYMDIYWILTVSPVIETVSETLSRLKCHSTNEGVGAYLRYYSPDFSTNCITRSSPPPPKNPNACSTAGSIIQVDNQVVGETIPLVGAPFELVYFSDRVVGRTEDYILRLPITETDFANTITNYNITIKNEADTVIENVNYTPSSNLTHTYQWNGLDVNSVESWGRARRNVIISETATDGSFPAYPTDVYLGGLKAKKLGTGAWIPSIWHFYDANSKTLFKGDGSYRVVEGIIENGLTRVADRSGKEIYYFDSTGKITQTKLGLTGTTIYTFAYDTAGRIKTITGAFNRITTFTRNTAGALLSIKAPNAAITTVVINSNGYLAEVTNPKLEKYLMTYHGTAGGLLQTFTKPSGDVTTLTYDSFGNLTNDSHTNGFSLTLTKTNGRVTATTAENIVSVNNKFTPWDSQEESRSPTGLIQYFQKTDDFYTSSSVLGNATYHYIPDPRLGQQVKILSNSSVGNFGTRSTSYTTTSSLVSPSDIFSVSNITEVKETGPSQDTSLYDGATKTWLTTSKLGRTNSKTIDIYERVSSETKGTQTPKVYTYTNDLLTKITQGVRKTTYAYHTNRLLKSVTNSLNQVTSYTYDTAQRLLTTVLPDLRVINYTYDFNGNMTSITPPSKPAHTLTYGLNEKLEDYSPPALASLPIVNTEYEYDLDKKLKKITRPDGEEINFNYDPTTSLQSTITGSFGTIQNFYMADLLTQVINQYGFSGSMNYTGRTVNYVEMSHSTMGNIYAYSRYPDSIIGERVGHEILNGSNENSVSSTINYSYDDDGYLITAGDLVLSHNVPNGQLSGTTLGNLQDTYGYNAFGEVIQYVVKNGTTVIYQYDLVRDNIGRVTQKKEIISGVTTTYNYTFDSSGRLTTVKTNNVVTSTYTYDSNSNRSGGTIRGVPTSATYDDQDMLISYNGTAFTYNANGELQAKGSEIFDYDIFGNLKQYTNGATSLVYEIDPFQRRLGQTLNAVNTSRIRYAYDPEGRLVGEIDYENMLTKRFVYGSKQHAPDYYVDSSGNKFKIVSDHLGSLRMVVNAATGAILQNMKHDEFGVVLQDTNPGLTPFGFAGGVYNFQSGMVRFGARDYDSQTGRWSAKDPIRFNGGDSNLYGYVLQDPINLIDPTGKSPLDDAKKNVRRCKKFINETLKEATCPTAKEMNKEYECAEWEDNLGEIINPRNWFPDDKKQSDNPNPQQ